MDERLWQQCQDVIERELEARQRLLRQQRITLACGMVICALVLIAAELLS